MTSSRLRARLVASTLAITWLVGCSDDTEPTGSTGSSATGTSSGGSGSGTETGSGSSSGGASTSSGTASGGGGSSGTGGSDDDIVLPASTVPPIAAPSGPTVYVDAKNGTDGGKGTAADPFLTIPEGVAAVEKSGGTVVIHDGTYQGPITIQGAAPILLQAASGESPVISCSEKATGWSKVSGSIYQMTPSFPVTSVNYQGDNVLRARFPSTGFLSIAADTGGGAPYTKLMMDPADAAKIVGNGFSNAAVTVRIVDYWYNSEKVSKIDGASGALTIDTAPTKTPYECDPDCSFIYEPQQGWGYYLENEAWMMTSAGSWAYDADQNLLSVWLPDSSDPSTVDVEISGASACLDVKQSPKLAAQGLRITRSGGNGITVEGNSPETRWSAITVDHVKRQGIGVGALPFTIDDSWVSHTGSDALSGYPNTGGYTNPDFIVEASKFTDIGTEYGPKFVSAAVGMDSDNVKGRLKNNYLARVSYVGINSPTGSLVVGNTVQDFCLNADDCGGLYVGGRDQNQTLQENIVRRATAYLEGKPANRGAYAVAGIYLDDFSGGMKVDSNIVSDTDIGLMMHNAHDDVIKNNVFVATRLGSSVREQEDSVLKSWDRPSSNFVQVLTNGKTTPAMTNDVFTSNLFAMVTANPVIAHGSNQGSTIDRVKGAFSGSGNVFWNLYSPVAIDSSAGLFGVPDLVPDGFDSAPKTAGFIDAWATTASLSKPFTATSANFTSFSLYAASGKPTEKIVTCSSPSTSGACMEVLASTTDDTLAITPTFAVTKDHFYKVTLQGYSESGTSWAQINFRHGGPTYESIDSLDQNVNLEWGTAPWLEYVVYFQASATIPNGRIDIGVPKSGKVVLGDVEVEEVTAAADPSSNHFQTPIDIDYSAALNAACTTSSCSGWKDRTGADQTFPLSVPARSATPVWHP